MSYLVLARKYRPQNFDEVLGQEATVQTLKNAIKQNRVAHAFLFSGPRGVGKTTLARVLAKALNCQAQDGPTVTPCGKCGPCVEITAGNAVDILEIDGASNRGIDNIRELRETVRYLPSSCRTKIYIIDEVHMLTTESFNALLKTLEEPPSHVVFMFATTEPHKVPSTILSRCQRYDLRRVGMQTLTGHLKKLCAAEGIILPDEAILTIAREAGGSVRDSLSLLDQVAGFGGEGVSDDDVRRILGVVDRALVREIAEAVFSRDPAAVLAALAGLDEFGHDIKQLSLALVRYFRNLAVVKLSRDPARLLEISDSELAELKALSDQHSIETIQRLFDQLVRLDEDLMKSGQPRLVLEMNLARMAITPPLAPVAELIAKLEDLETKMRGGNFDDYGPESGSSRPAPISSSGQPAGPPTGIPSSTAPVAPSAPAGPRNWDGFIAFAENRDQMIASFLRLGAVSGESPAWRLTFPAGAPSAAILRERQTAVDGLVTEYFGSGVKLSIMDDEAPARGEAPARVSEDSERRKEALNDPVVQALMDELGGDVTSLKLR